MRRATFLLASLMLFSSATLARILLTLSYQAVLTDTTVVAKPAGTIIGKAMTALKNGSGLVIPSLAFTFLLSLVGMPALAQDIVVYAVLGREVAVLVNELKAPGTYAVRFDGTRLASGVYVYRIHAGNVVQSKKLLPLRQGF